MRRILLAALALTFATQVNAGNEDRRGSAGSNQLLINPWARSAGFHSLNTASVTGIEAMRLNLGGLARMDTTELYFSSSLWLVGSDVKLNALGFAQRVGEAGAIGITLMTVGLGEWDITTTDNPEGGVGTIRPQLFNLGLGYSRSFSESVHGGMVVRMISESIQDASARGIGLDAGIQYTPNEKIRFGISLRSVGTPMKFGGDGLSFKGDAPGDNDYNMTVEQRSARFELPSLLHIGGAYNLELSETNRLTLLANFTSNTFKNDQLGIGAEYAFKEQFMLRLGYKYEEGLFGPEQANTVYTGLAGGFSFDVPITQGGPKLGLDYAYRTSDPLGGTHSLGVRLNL